jgi:glycosyl transferase family 25
MLAYVINLDSASARWEHMVAAFRGADVRLVRVPAVDGGAMKLPTAELDLAGFHRWHGREINVFEVACYLSHLKAMTAFLDDTDAEHALILEDDVTPAPGIDLVIREALKSADAWSVLRMSGLSPGRPLTVRKLSGGYSICVSFGRTKGAGAYIVNRLAARRFVDHMLPITVPYDHAVDREWFWGLKAASVLPFPISQTDGQFRSSIQHNSQQKLSRARRFGTTYPYQAFNELTRYIFRLASFAVWKADTAQAPEANPVDLGPLAHPLPVDPPRQTVVALR